MRRINLFGGPGSGKSTLAASIFSHYKQQGIKIELVREYAKFWAYRKHDILPYDQLLLFAKQIQEESMLLQEGVNLIITDSPILLSAFYSKSILKPFIFTEELLKISNNFDEIYPCTNIFINRCNKPYIRQGRYQTEQEAKQIDKNIINFLNENNIFLHFVKYSDTMLSDVLEIVDNG